jgi:hypothetical protein
MKDRNFYDIFQEHQIAPKYWPGLTAMVLAGAKPEIELQVRLECVENYRCCLRDLLAGTRDSNQLSPAVPFESIDT